jgi:hypothetical protein
MSAAGTLPLPSAGIGSLVGLDLDGDLDGDLVAFTTLNFTDLIVTRFVNQGGTLVPMAQVFPGVTGGTWHAGDWDGDGRVDVNERSPAPALRPLIGSGAAHGAWVRVPAAKAPPQ